MSGSGSVASSGSSHCVFFLPVRMPCNSLLTAGQDVLGKRNGQRGPQWCGGEVWGRRNIYSPVNSSCSDPRPWAVHFTYLWKNREGGSLGSGKHQATVQIWERPCHPRSARCSRDTSSRSPVPGLSHLLAQLLAGASLESSGFCP